MAIVQGITAKTQYANSGALDRRETRSFAELYRQARSAQVNDNGAANAELVQEQEQNSTRQNRDYIAGLHDRVDSLRGEILARMITAKANRENPENFTGDISRLHNRLEGLRTKLREEEERLSGHLVDVVI